MEPVHRTDDPDGARIDTRAEKAAVRAEMATDRTLGVLRRLLLVPFTAAR
jgi:hypothetical protein